MAVVMRVSFRSSLTWAPKFDQLCKWSITLSFFFQIVISPISASQKQMVFRASNYTFIFKSHWNWKITCSAHQWRKKWHFHWVLAQRCASCVLQMWRRSICFSFSSFMCYVFCMEALIRMLGVLFNDTWAHRSLLYQWITAFLPAYLLRTPSHFPNASLQYSGDKWGVLG